MARTRKTKPAPPVYGDSARGMTVTIQVDGEPQTYRLGSLPFAVGRVELRRLRRQWARERRKAFLRSWKPKPTA